MDEFWKISSHVAPINMQPINKKSLIFPVTAHHFSVTTGGIMHSWKKIHFPITQFND